MTDEFNHGSVEEEVKGMEGVTKGGLGNQDDVQKGGQQTVVFETKDFTANPVNFVGTNIPSFYGGLSTGAWEKYKFKNLLPQALVQEQDQELRQGVQSTSDFKMEFLGQDNCIAMLFRRIKRICQV